MGSSQSRSLSQSVIHKPIEIIITTYDDDAENESDDEFIECSDNLISDSSTNVCDGISNDDEIGKKAEPLERNPKALDDGIDCDDSAAIQGTKLFSRKHSESDGDDEDESSEGRKERQRKEMEDFREEMNKKRELRQQCIKKLREELIDLREKLSTEIETNEQLRVTLEQHGVNKSMQELVDENKQLKIELAECQMYLQTSNSENINNTLENSALKDQVRSLKEVIKATKEMLKIRECQVDQMKSKLTEIEATFAEKEMKIMSTALQQEYQRQLENIRNMRELYEERANLLTQEKNTLQLQLEEKDQDLKTEIEKSKNLDEYIATLENNVKLKNTDISMLESEIGCLKSEKSQVASEMNAVNQLISQVLFGFGASGNSIDIDKLVSMLEQNRDLLNEMAIKEDYYGVDEGYFLPKLLYEIFIQANQNSNENNPEAGCSSNATEKQQSSPEEIAEKLPKVWRVLIELLSHHKKLIDEEERVLDDCYKSVQTPTGPQNVISVSKTFIKLKDLILEKRSLQKDTTRLKTLYSHLEQRLDKQEKRLSNVSLELTKTWHIVGKIKRQHRSLHTAEMMLQYQLQQKRRVLSELKAELEYCRKKWALARALNNDSEEQCKQLRQEFRMRKIQDQNSAESGYSDEHPSDGDDDAAVVPSEVNIAERFDQNLIMFDRTASPSCLERRRSESVIEDFRTLIEASTRAQSEPPLMIRGENERFEQLNEFEDFVVLDLIPEPILVPSVATMTLNEDPRNELIVTPPPTILQYNKNNLPKVKTHLKKHKKRKTPKKGQSESAEEMFLRLTACMHGDSCSCSSATTTTEDGEDDSENVEEIQDLPMDQPSTSGSIDDEKLNVVQCETLVEESSFELVEQQSPEPSTTQPTNDLSTLTTTEQEYLQKREARLARLEAEAKEFYDRMARNRDKGKQLNDHLMGIHQSFVDRRKDKSKAENSGSEPSNSEASTSNKEKADEPEKYNDSSDDEET